ncbi:protein tonB [Luteimonas chenhongjianii]|uniref:protein tonB n=1 Tax=Luteimonas chenhongjianii TaxID=2006110 RepID=UPI0012FE6AB0|nr:protein tonB [Luteimonas chenhongjianii]
MHRTLSALLGIAFLAAAAPVADAQNARQARQQVEASMLVTGHVDIDRDGRVSAHVLDRPDKLPPYVIDLVERALPALRFEPILVDGAPVLARAKMSIRLVAKPTGDGDGNMQLRIAGAHFGEEYSDSDRTSVRRSNLRPPRYPMNIAQIGGKGTVYLLVQVGRDGRPMDVVAEQVNLTAVGSAREMEMIRTALAKTAVDNARKHWVFTPPDAGEAAGRDYWVVRVPVDFRLDNSGETAHGKWIAYHPGPVQRPAWAAPAPLGFSPDTLVAGGMTPESSRFKLLTALEG